MKNATKNVVQYDKVFGLSGYGQITWDFQTGPFPSDNVEYYVTLNYNFPIKQDLSISFPDLPGLINRPNRQQCLAKAIIDHTSL